MEKLIVISFFDNPNEETNLYADSSLSLQVYYPPLIKLILFADYHKD